jgi:hypothetical protein
MMGSRECRRQQNGFVSLASFTPLLTSLRATFASHLTSCSATFAPRQTSFLAACTPFLTPLRSAYAAFLTPFRAGRRGDRRDRGRGGLLSVGIWHR